MTKIGIALVSMLFLSLAVVIKPVAGGATVVKVDPSLIEYYEDATGQQFTVAIKIVDVTNLYGFDIKFRWNTTFLEYVSDSVHVPWNATPAHDGVLYNPFIFNFTQVNATTGTYWIAYSSRYPAPSFNGSGTVFNMTFKVKQQPVQPQPDAYITLELYSTDLAARGGAPIPHTRENGTVILHALAARHDVVVVGVHPGKTIVGQGYSMQINVTLANQGDFTETFNATVYANTSAIQTKTLTLTSGNSTTITSTWNTTGFAKGNYTIWAYAWPMQNETDIINNNCTDGSVLITKVGDLGGGAPVAHFFQCDGIIDPSDTGLFIRCLRGTAPLDAMYLGDLGGGAPVAHFFQCDGLVDPSDTGLFIRCLRGQGPPDP
jgi:hypothetical protein